MIKKIAKYFILTLVILTVIIGVGFRIFKLSYTPSHLRENTDKKQEEKKIEKKDGIKEEKKPPTWAEFKAGSDRVNVLLFGTDGFRADTLIVLSYSQKENDVFMLTVPRDTKHEVEGMIYEGQDKINAVFCFPGDKGGAENQKKAIEELLDIPIHYYIKVNYYSLVGIVDILGGIEVDVPFKMNYDDRWAKPELHIHLNKGKQVLDGHRALGYIRWRKNNNGKGDSDLARTKRQQDFLIRVIKKSVGLNLPKVIKSSYGYIKSSMSLEDMLYYGTELVGFDLDKIKRASLPGTADYKYFYQDKEKTEELIKELYNFKDENK